MFKEAFLRTSPVFSPDEVAVREHLARQHADQILKQFIDKFSEKNFFPDDSEALVFALLTQLPAWPADAQIKVLDEYGGEIATYLKGTNAGVVKLRIVLVQSPAGHYSAQARGTQGSSDDEALFRLILNQLPSTSDLGKGGDFPGSNSTAGRIVTLRTQIAEMVKTRRAEVFDALLADETDIRNDQGLRWANPFLPFWRRQLSDYSPLLEILLALNPEVPASRLDALLEQNPLSETQEADVIQSGVLPESFVGKMQQSIEEWRAARAIDGVLNTRSYNIDTDQLAREHGSRLLKERTGRELVILDRQGGYESTGPDDTSIVLWSDGAGNYMPEDLRNGQIIGLRGADSFYEGIALLLQPHERLLMGMQFDGDVEGLRNVLGQSVITANGGWFDTESPLEVDSKVVPDWLKNAQAVDKALWQDAIQGYTQAVVEAQVEGVPDLVHYADPKQLRSYAKEQVELRLATELGVQLNADKIFAVTSKGQWSGSWEPPPYVFQRSSNDIHFDKVSRSLTQLCLDNLEFTDLDFLLGALIVDHKGIPVSGLTPSFVFSLVRDLNVGASYTRFLEHKLLASPAGQWCREQYAQVLQAAMRVDAIEANLSGNFADDSGLPYERADRSYKWVKAILDHPVDDGTRQRVEGHAIQVQKLSIEGITLDRILIIGTASAQSVPTIVVYTPDAPDHICFRELDSLDTLRKELVGNSRFRDYLIDMAPPVSQADLEDALGVLSRTSTAPYSGNFLHDRYDSEVRRTLEVIDKQTTTTGEADWNAAWSIIKVVGEVALEFTPFKVRLPVAALLSLYALSQAAQANGKGESAMRVLDASLLLLGAIPGLGLSKVKRPVAGRPAVIDFSRRQALSKIPNGLTQRTDGIYEGVFEKVYEGERSFYLVQDGKAYPVRHEASQGVWRLIDPRQPAATYQTPVARNANGVWDFSPVGGQGGNQKFRKKKPGAGSDGASGSGLAGIKRLFTLDMDGFFESSAFKKAQKKIQDDLVPPVNKAVDRYRLEGKGHLHPSEAGLYSLDLPGVGGSTGRGAWRLMFSPPDKGVMKAHSIRDPH